MTQAAKRQMLPPEWAMRLPSPYSTSAQKTSNSSRDGVVMAPNSLAVLHLQERGSLFLQRKAST